jgi:hypothetical protein
VTAWTDNSGNGFNATVANNAPSKIDNNLNNNPTISFDRANTESMQVTNGILGTSTFNDSWVYVVSKTNNSGVRNTILNENLANSEGFNILLTWNNANTYFDFGKWQNVGRINGLWGGINSAFNMWTYGTSTGTSTPNGTRKAISRDGLAILSNNNNDNATGNNQNLYIGARYQGVDNYYLGGDIAELIVYTGVPSAIEQEKIQSYLAVKYGMTKNSADNGSTVGQDERDYFAGDGTVIWDYSVNSAYHFDVTGVGRDDISALSQQKSKSINASSDVTIDKGGAFGTDGDFILWGNNDAANGTSTNVPVGYQKRINRVWKTSVTGTPGAVNFELDLTDLGLPTGLSAADYVFLLDDDGDFSS